MPPPRNNLRIVTLLNERSIRESLVRSRNDQARFDIKMKMSKEDVKRRHNLSETAYDQLARSVIAGWVKPPNKDQLT